MYWATFPLPETRQRLPSRLSPPGDEHLGGEVDDAVAGGLGPDQRPPQFTPLPVMHAGELVGDALVLPEEVADLALAHADVAGGDVGELADVAAELGHERLAEPTDLGVALALGVEVRPALAAAHGQRGEGVLEHLLEGQELEDTEVDRRMEPQAAFVGPDGAVHLDPIPPVDLDVALVVDPVDAEEDGPLRLGHPLQDPLLAVLGVPLEQRRNRSGHESQRLVERGLARRPRLDLG